ncbi:hypothetical protein B5S32_g2029 [[Candida] boidinii]|nr:hypothetical protein B5S32_g2029 [[Candida] boidinii]
MSLLVSSFRNEILSSGKRKLGLGSLSVKTTVFPKRNNLGVVSARRNFSLAPVLDVLHQGADILQTIHIESGLPWWAFIPLATFCMRSVITLPIAIIQRRGIQKQNSFRPIINSMSPILKAKLASSAQQAQLKRSLDPITHIKTETEQLTADKIVAIAAKEKWKRQRKIFKENGCQTWKFMILPAIQIPLWVSMSYMFRTLTGWNSMSTKPLDISLTTEGLGWVTDLALPDPYMTLPIILGVVALSNAEWNFRTADLMKLTTRGMKNSLRPTAFDVVITVARASIIFLMAMATQAPAAIVLYWVSSNTFSLCQNYFLDRFLPLRYSPYNRFPGSKAKLSAIPLVKLETR